MKHTGGPARPARPEPTLDLETRIQELARRRKARPAPDAKTLLPRRWQAAWANACIEGNPVSWPEAQAFFAAEQEGDDSLARRELRGCLQALAFMDRGLPLPWRPALLRHLHALLMKGISPEAGLARRHPVEIVRESGPDRGQTVFKPPHPLRVPELLAELLAGLDPAEDPFLQAGRFHYAFQSIHAFADGNGRLGRILSTALARRGWEGRGFYLAPAIKRAGSAYYLALRAVRPDYQSEPRDGLRPWLLPFFEMLADALDDPGPPSS